MPCGREINDPPSPVLLHLARRPPGWSSRTSIPSVHGASPAVLLGHPASVAVTAAAILFHLRLPVPLPMSTTDHSLASLSPPVVPHPLDQRPGDGTTRKAGFKIIMARAILITVARTTTISGWHHYYYKSIVHAAATPPTTTAIRTSPPSPFDISLHVSPFMRARHRCKERIMRRYGCFEVYI